MTFTTLPLVGRSRAAPGGLLVDPAAWLMRGVVEPFLSAMIVARQDSVARRADNGAVLRTGSGRLNA